MNDQDAQARLAGSWRTDPTDLRSLQEYGNVTLEFEEEGRLAYTIHLPKKKQIMHLTYRVEGSWLVTDQPSHPQEERSEFFFTSDGRLALKHPGTSLPPSLYVRV